MGTPRVALVYSLDSAPTAIVSEIARHALDLLKNYDVKVDEYGVLKATRFFFHFNLLFRRYDGILYFGHGWYNELIGQLPFGYVFPLIRVGDRVKTKILYAVACVAGTELGPYLERKGLVSAALMNTNYTYVALPDEDHDYLSDFIDIFLTPIDLLAKGQKIYRAHRAMRDKIIRYIGLYNRYVDKWANADFYIAALKSNLDFKLFGDPDATLFD